MLALCSCNCCVCVLDRLPEESVVTTVDVVRVKREAKSTQVKTVQPVGHTEVISVQGKRDRRTVADIMKVLRHYLLSNVCCSEYLF